MSESPEMVTKWIGAIKRYSQLFVGRNLENRSVGPGQLPILIFLYKQDGISQDVIAKHLFLDKATVTRSLEFLESQGLIRRESCTTDRRKKLVYLTKKAGTTKEEYQRLMSTWNELLLTGLTPAEQQTLVRLLEKVHQNAAAHFAQESDDWGGTPG